MKNMKLVAKNITTQAAHEYIETNVPYGACYTTGNARTLTAHYILNGIELAATTYHFDTKATNLYIAK